jgi:glycine cleavage system H protein
VKLHLARTDIPAIEVDLLSGTLFESCWQLPVRILTVSSYFTNGGIFEMTTPKDLRYSEEHEWVKVEGEKVRVGITEFAQHELGDIVFVELPEVGTEITIDQPFGSVESVKTVSELYAPVSGKVVEINEELNDSPESVNESPYEKAWMIVIEATDLSEVEKLLTPEQYDDLIKAE